ncbi:MAG: hypothetical protein OXQ94_01920 [Gemmatimonadota bacterium]|nr:hypothetical protein [Gemmatimonadota bacterium]MDE2870437.1 hypothetical protein [Gemmatimonadota bacterium]
MTVIHPCRPILLFGALPVSLGAPAAQVEGQPRSVPERPLSAAIAEALGSPFHGDRVLTRSGGHGLLGSSAASLSASSAHIGTASSPAPVPEGDRTGAGADKPSQGKVFVLTAIATVACGLGVGYWYSWCHPPVRNLNAGGVKEWVGDNVICPDEDVMNVVSPLVVMTATAGANKLVGNGFWRSLAGSALGLAGGAFMMVGAAESLDPPDWVLGGVMILTHAWTTTLITG